MRLICVEPPHTDQPLEFGLQDRAPLGLIDDDLASSAGNDAPAATFAGDCAAPVQLQQPWHWVSVEKFVG